MTDTDVIKTASLPPLAPAGTKILQINSEKCRCYHYANGQKYRIDYPLELYILPNGSHRVIDEEGVVHRPTPGWIALSWIPKPDAPAFVA